MAKKKILVLAIDRDNDLYESCNIVGPVIGRDNNLKAASKMALADPEDPDANVMFQAVKLYDELSKDYDVEVATVTGSKKLGYEADRNISMQIEKIIEEFPAKSCILVSDGAQDEEVIPIIKSRIKVDSVKLVIMKQAKALEKTYVVILEKMKDPYYSKIFLGVPALIILLYTISTTFNLGWQPVAIIISLYLIAKVLHIDDYVWKAMSSFGFSLEKASFLIYLAAITLILISLWMASQKYFELVGHTTAIILFSSVLQSFLLLCPLSLLLFIGGKMIDAVNDKHKIAITNYGFYAVGVVLLNLVLSAMTKWVVNDKAPYVSFGDFVNIMILTIILGYVSIYSIKKIRKTIIKKLRLEDKECITERGMYLGRIVGIDSAKEKLILQTPFGTKLNFAVENVIDVSDRVVIRD
ncbi:DUF373 family protein [Candidatus Micrarchaeota archaeon]|nr:DUF373 family protein [Candidatus Micrarchaeota archaeon]